MNNFKTVLKSFRIQFLILTPIVILYAIAISYNITNNISFIDASLAMLGAILSHIAVNLLNEYYDFKSGLDLITKRTPFSGGSGALPENPKALKYTFYAGCIAVVATILIGIYFVFFVTPFIIPIGVLGVLLIVLYTTIINKRPILCFISPGFGFGILMILGTVVVLTKTINLYSVALSLIPFFLVNNLLLINQYPDLEADKQVGRNHILIKYGVDFANKVYLLSTILVFIIILLLIYFSYLPILACLSFFPLSLSLGTIYGIFKLKLKIAEEPLFLVLNLFTVLLTPITLFLVMFVEN
jgi:1,4-dihydroxy-2-naphthoate octaprenyltransferase